MPQTSDDPASVIQGQLEAGERLLWAGRPRAGIRFQPAYALYLPFSLAFLGFVMFWGYLVFVHARIFYIPLMIFWFIFVLVSVENVIGPVLLDKLNRETSYYGVTDRRAIVVSHLFKGINRSIELSAVTEMQVKEKSDGSGTIFFVIGYLRPVYRTGSYLHYILRGASAFEQIPQVWQVEQIVRDAKRQQARAAGS